MAKLALFPLLLVISCIVAGMYGAIHNQISYTVSPDYFHAFKFYQFGIPPELWNRAGAAIVGWHAAWWMGILVGFPVLLLGLIMPDGKTYFTRCLVAMGVVVVTALMVGAGALIYAHCTITESELPYWVPGNVTDTAAFARAGTMHDFTYLGGFFGIITGSFYLIYERTHE